MKSYDINVDIELYEIMETVTEKLEIHDCRPEENRCLIIANHYNPTNCTKQIVEKLNIDETTKVYLDLRKVNGRLGKYEWIFKFENGEVVGKDFTRIL